MAESLYKVGFQAGQWQKLAFFFEEQDLEKDWERKAYWHYRVTVTSFMVKIWQKHVKH